MNLDKSRIDTLEHNIRPPMGIAITLPVNGAGMEGFCVYVVASSLSEDLLNRKYIDVVRTLKSVAANLTL